MKRDELFEEKMKNINKKMLVMKECFFAMLNDDSILSKNYCNIIDMRLSINYVIFYGYNYLLNYANYDECVLFLEFRNKLKKTVNFKKELSLIYEFDECKCGYFNLINEKDVDDYDLFLAKMYYWLYASEIEKYIFVKKLKMYFIDKKTKISNKNFALFTFATFIKYGKNSTEFDELKYDFMWIYDKTIKCYPLIYYKQYANDI